MSHNVPCRTKCFEWLICWYFRFDDDNIFSRSLKLEPTSQYIRVMSYEHHGISNYQQFHCLFNRLLMHILKTTSKLRVTGLCVRGIHRWSADSPEKGSVKWQITPLHDVINLRRDFTGSRRSCSRCRVAWFRLISENIHNLEIVPDNKVHEANMGPSGSCRPQMDHMLAPWTLLSGINSLASGRCGGNSESIISNSFYGMIAWVIYIFTI